MLREVRFNVGGDPKDDAPYILPDRVVDPGTSQPVDEKPEPIPMVLGSEDATGTFFPGQDPRNRGQAFIPQKNTGGSDVWYQHGSKSFRLVLPPPEKEFQNEAGDPNCLPPEYHGDADKVALHYTWAPPVRVNVVLEGKNWRDSNGYFFPLGHTYMHALGTAHREGLARITDDFRWMKAEGFDTWRGLGQVDWAGQEIDPFWPDYPQLFASVLEASYNAGLLLHLTAIGGKCKDPFEATRIMCRVIAEGRRHMAALTEATNEDKALTTEDAVKVTQVLKTLGLPSGIGMGNTGDGNLVAGGNAAAANLDFFHRERTPPGTRQIRQCWDFHKFNRSAVDNEGPGHASSGGGTCDDPVVFAYMRFGAAIMGAPYYVKHSGSAVYGYDYESPYGHRYASPRQDPNCAEINRGLRNAVKRLPGDVANWVRYNTEQDLPLRVPSGNVDKVYGSTDGNRYAQIIVGARGGVTLQAQRPVVVQVINVMEDTVIAEGELRIGQSLRVEGFDHYGVVGQRA